jgi:hypothetical protein
MDQSVAALLIISIVLAIIHSAQKSLNMKFEFVLFVCRYRRAEEWRFRPAGDGLPTPPYLPIATCPHLTG